jgi:hypothetical protein
VISLPQLTKNFQQNITIKIKIRNMGKADIIVITAAFAAIGFSLYRKYIRKNQEKTGKGPESQYGSSFSSPSKDDDYEPYSKK